MNTPASSSLPPAPSQRQPRSRRFLRGLILLVLTASLMTLAFPAYCLWFLAPLCLVPFALCVLRRPMVRSLFFNPAGRPADRSAPTRRAGWSGGRWLLIYYLFGVAWFLINLYWLVPVSGAGALALCFFIGLYWALFAFAFYRMVVHLRWPATFALPLAWVTAEYLRATVFSGFAWFLLGTSLAPCSTLIQIADIFGVWGLSFFCAMTAGWLVDLLRLPLWHAGKIAPAVRRLTTVYLATLFAVIVYGLFRLHQSTTTPGPRVAVVQVSVPQSIKDDPDAAARDKLFQQHIDLSRAALQAAPAPQLVVWSETIVPAILNPEWFRELADNAANLTAEGKERYQRSMAYDRALTELAHASGAALLVGAPGADPAQDAMMNTALLYTAAGQSSPYYAKRTLVPFGEYVPFKESIPWLHKFLLGLTPVDGDYTLTPGPDWTRFKIPAAPLPSPFSPENSAQSSVLNPQSFTFGVPICYEDVMPGPCRAFVDPVDGRKQVDFLVSISNDGWYSARDELGQHLQMDQIRAVENRTPIARSVNGGNSGFVDSNGRILRLVQINGQSTFVAGAATETLPLDSRISLYSRIGDLLPITCGIITALGVAWTILRPRRNMAEY